MSLTQPLIKSIVQQPIPTNIITGFLGVGKTSLIKRLLATKPDDEVWAVLVNEFGEIGIDASLLGSKAGGNGIEIKEVAGGCMCCAAGVPMQVAINQLIARAKPDRLLIEPTGLGHPQEVIRVLTQPHFQQVIKMNTCLTLVDARKITDSRYTEHAIFNQQLAVADVIVATKQDCYQSGEVARLNDYLVQNHWHNKSCLNYSDIADAETVTVDIKKILALLTLEHRASNDLLQLKAVNRAPQSATQAPKRLIASVKDIPTIVFDKQLTIDGIDFDERGLFFKQKKLKATEDYYSCGWVFSPQHEFDFDAVISFIRQQSILRIKAVLITQEGIVGVNCIDGEMKLIELDDTMDSRIELIDIKAIDAATFEMAWLKFISA